MSRNFDNTIPTRTPLFMAMGIFSMLTILVASLVSLTGFHLSPVATIGLQWATGVTVAVFVMFLMQAIAATRPTKDALPRREHIVGGFLDAACMLVIMVGAFTITACIYGDMRPIPIFTHVAVWMMAVCYFILQAIEPKQASRA